MELTYGADKSHNRQQQQFKTTIPRQMDMAIPGPSSLSSLSLAAHAVTTALTAANRRHAFISGYAANCLGGGRTTLVFYISQSIFLPTLDTIQESKKKIT